MNILGIRIDNLNKHQALEKVANFLNSEKQNKIFTPNPEMLVDARKDEYFREVLNSGDLNICDGKGIELVSRGKLKRVPGVDFMLDICELAKKENKSIYLLGSGSDEVVKKTAEVLQEKFPLLKIVGYNSGLKIERLKDYKIRYDKDKNEDLIYGIIVKAPDMLFVAFGHGKQEKWIEENLVDLPSVKVTMGVGGSFDFISGKTKRAPKWMRKIGLEWLYRFIREPKRLGRILKATFKFLYLNLRHKKQDTNK